MQPLIGIVGKPNTGKSTFFNAATLSSVPVASHPFTTINPNIGVAYVKRKCVCREFNVRDNPKNSYCIKGFRFIPFKIVDTAGLVPGAWMGKGLGNQFLDKISRANALIQVVDASGATDENGNIVKPGLFDPLNEVLFLEEELTRWFEGILKRDWDKIVMKSETRRSPVYVEIYEKLSGLNFTLPQIKDSVKSVKKDPYHPRHWTRNDLLYFVRTLIKKARPVVIAANKAEYDCAEENIKKLRENGCDVTPTSALSEWILRRLAGTGLISYIPGESRFEILGNISERQRMALKKIKEFVLDRWRSTGIQKILNHVIFDVLKWIVVYPVRDPDKLTDSDGNILPDALLMPPNSTGRNLATSIHSEIANKISYLVDVRRKIKRSSSYILKDNDVLSIVLK